MKWSEVIQSGLFPGAVAGLAGGVVFGGTMSELGLLPTFAQLVRTDSSAVGFIMVMAVAGIVGGGFGTLVCHQRPGVGETFFWGLAYGIFWWYLGPLTLMPLLQGDGLTWDVRSAQAEFPTFLGHVLYGATTGLALVMLQWRRYVESRSLDGIGGAVLRGSMAGLLGAGLLGVMLNAQNQLQAFAAMVDSDSRSVAWLPVLLTGLLAGLAFSVMYPHPAKGDGAGFVRGMVYGIFWWVLGGLTLVPLLSGDGLTWSLEEVRQSSITLPAYLFFGTAVALFYQWLGALVRLLFSDFVGTSGQEGVGTQGLRIVGRSVLGGLVGGLLFSLVMLQTDFLPNVAALVGSTSSVAGFFVHLGIATVIGTSYGLLFRSQSYDIPSALGWGVSYGFFWSILGPMTLMPIFLGSTVQWTVEGMAATFPNLIGHLAYGAGLGITFYLLEARYSPWWVPRTRAQVARVAHQKEQVLTSAPALWTMLVAVGLALPVLLAS